ncbi:MAG TPA: hypothetical protein VEW42_02235 [Candidatus Eisenbacteria bacterium]|nr:hypothetical protein [Candidatus Eisenbacteria bacterium]
MAEIKDSRKRIDRTQVDRYLQSHKGAVNPKDLADSLRGKGPAISRQTVWKMLRTFYPDVEIMSQRASTDATYRERIEQRDEMVANARRWGETEVRIADALDLGTRTVQKSVSRLVQREEIEQFRVPRTGHLPVHDDIIALTAAGWTTKQISKVVPLSQHQIWEIARRNNGGTELIREAIRGVQEGTETSLEELRELSRRTRTQTRLAAGATANKITDTTPSASHRGGMRHGWSLEPNDVMGIINALDSDMSNPHPDNDED